jgi:ferredoxin
MTIRVKVDRALCELHGLCVETAPEVFSFDSSGALVYTEHARDELAQAIADAQFLCPTQAIEVEQE